MHPSLYYFSCYSWHTILESEETTLKVYAGGGFNSQYEFAMPCLSCLRAETRVNKAPEKIRFPLCLLDTPYGKMHRNCKCIKKHFHGKKSTAVP
ncbi:hypothetical protein CDAR_374341 [Caerostris darwini]|uniref:Uncharacterized protein n=1 Tax=Caerostris darwini TaxID=1538125 RepID=A0AAV4QTM0_9ARAC|nr:hypothetical protein CDAR_374341 [Caerostris darwini]